MLINSPALNKVVAEFGSEEKIAQFNRGIRLALLETGMSVGYLQSQLLYAGLLSGYCGNKVSFAELLSLLKFYYS